MDLKDIIGYCATQANSVYTGINSVVSRYAIGLSGEVNRPDIRNLINTGHPVGAVIAIMGGISRLQSRQDKRHIQSRAYKKGQS